MKASLIALSLVALAAQHDVNAAAAGLSSSDPAARAHAACELRALGREAAPAIDRLTAMLADASPLDPSVCGEHTWRFRGAQELTTPGEQAASALVAIGAQTAPVLRTTLAGPAWIALGPGSQQST